ncbi:MAG: energy transducer TonB [Bacteroidales bacterium]
MKRINTCIVFLSLISLMNNNIFSQTTDDQNMAINNAEKPNLLLETKEEVNFVDLFEINTGVVKKAKTLGDTYMRKSPSADAEHLDQVIPQGTIVETYNYFPKEASWAIKFNNTWGFVPATMIMPVKENAVPSDFTPYDEPPKMLSSINLKYPPEAKKAGSQGKVVMKILISNTGEVKVVEVIKSIPELDAAAMDAVKKIKFRPGKYKGKPVEVWMRIPINFGLETF